MPNVRELLDFWADGSRRPGAMFESGHRDEDITIHHATKVCQQRDIGITCGVWRVRKAKAVNAFALDLNRKRVRAEGSRQARAS